MIDLVLIDEKWKQCCFELCFIKIIQQFFIYRKGPTQARSVTTLVLMVTLRTVEIC